MTAPSARILVTAGPTREHLDDVRFLSNPASGKMGFAVAAAATRAGYQVTLIAGPVALPTPEGVERIDVTTTDEMRNAVIEHFDAADAVVMAAAPCDYRPAEHHPGKIKKTATELVVHMVRTPDILGELAAIKGGKTLIGFALEAHAGRHNAMVKLRRKNLDVIVLNSPQAFGADTSSAIILFPNGREEVLDNTDKDIIAERLIGLICDPAPRRQEPK